jgi:hypothetical protein
MRTIRIFLFIITCCISGLVHAQVSGFGENFDATSGYAMPAGWGGAAVDSVNFGTDDYAADHTSGSGRYAWMSNGYIISMHVNPLAYILNFWMRISSTPAELVKIGYCTNPLNIAGTFVQLDSVMNTNTTWTFYSFEFFFTTDCYLTFKCTGTSKTHMFDDMDLIWVLGTDKHRAGPGKIAVYPNPAGDELNIAWPNENDKHNTVVLSDMQGRVLIEDNTAANEYGLNKISMNTTELANGIYLITVKDNDHIISVKKVAISR